MQRIFLSFVLLLALWLVGCSINKAPLIPADDLSAQALAQSEFVNINNDFSFELFRKINTSKQDTNVFISPFSVSMALGMTLNGAHGNTFEQIRQVLGYESHDLQTINQTYKNYFELLMNSDAQVVLELANAIWYDQNFTVLPSFLDANQQYFEAEARQANFSDPATLMAINNWVKEKTHDKIQSILNYIPRDAVLYLLNAIYFKGAWMYAFDPQATRDWSFRMADGQSVNCPMMFLTKKLLHYKGNNFEMVQLPYGNGNFNMAVILPDVSLSLDSLLAELNFTQWQSWLEACQADSGTIGLPRFKMEFEMVLNDLLNEMGMPDAFSPTKADFSNMTPESGVYISLVKHKTFVEVNEEGTEAAGVTIVGFERTSSDFFEMIASRPFLFVIYEKDSRAILFIGKMVKPA